MLTIKDRSFTVTSATFDAILSYDDKEGWHLGWYFDVETEGVWFEEQLWQPHLYAEGLRLTVPDPRNLTGLRISIPEAYDYERDVYLVTLYVWEHEDVYVNEIAFRDQEGETFEVHWTAQCDVGWDDEYGIELPLSLETRMRFSGITVFAENLDEAVHRLREFYAPEWFVSEKSRVGFNFRLR